MLWCLSRKNIESQKGGTNKLAMKTIAKTGAIACFCGKLSGLYHSNNEFAAAKADEVIDLYTGITNQIRPALREKIQN